MFDFTHVLFLYIFEPHNKLRQHMRKLCWAEILRKPFSSITTQVRFNLKSTTETPNDEKGHQQRSMSQARADISREGCTLQGTYEVGWVISYGARQPVLACSQAHVSCGSTRPFAHGKMRLYPWGVCVLCVTSIPTVKLPMGNHYGYIKRTKELPMTFPEPSRRV